MGMFRNALVLIGRNHEDIAGMVPTLDGPRFATQVHLLALQAMLSGRLPAEPDTALFWGLGALLTVLGLALGLIDHPLWWLGGGLFVLADLWLAAAWLLHQQSLWIAPQALMAAGLTGFLLARLALPRLRLPLHATPQGELAYEQKGFPF
ncbi:MAG: hypothetical protein HC901_03760 [Bdellovibrionaceae bacterium]|nr:hypothetical protein [Pseudobdellovibrionaceae bacterium]